MAVVFNRVTAKTSGGIASCLYEVSCCLPCVCAAAIKLHCLTSVGLLSEQCKQGALDVAPCQHSMVVSLHGISAYDRIKSCVVIDKHSTGGVLSGWVPL
jgi:peroxiredoxin family protein